MPIVKDRGRPVNTKTVIKHLYPVLITLAVIVLTVLKISGSSVGMYHHFLDDGSDPALISGSPRSIRADEWLILTPKIISQELNGYPRVNPDIGFGEDATVSPSLPSTDWSVFFRPENLSFFVLPFEQAFAFRWWFFIGLLIVTTYYFSLRFFTSSIIRAIMLSLFVAFSPLFQWTYREFLFMAVSLGMLIVLTAHALTKLSLQQNKSRVRIFLLGALLVYELISFTLILYPPFQIITALVFGAFYIDKVREMLRGNTRGFRQYVRAHSKHLLAFSFSLLLLGGFYLAHGQTIGSIINTKHPGFRSFETGTFSRSDSALNYIFTNGAMPQILEKGPLVYQTDYYQKSGTHNQSEAAGVLWLLPALMVAAWHVSRKGNKPIPYASIGVSALILVILFLPGLDLPLLRQIPPMRWNLAIVLMTFILFGITMRNSKSATAIRRKLAMSDMIFFAFIMIFGAIVVYSFIGLTKDFTSLFDTSDVKLGLWLIITPLLFLGLKKPLIALIFVTVPTVAITYNVNPLYQGFGSILNQPLIVKIADIDSRDKGTWAVTAGLRELSPLPLLAGARSLTGHHSYPQDFWKKISNDDKTIDYITNRAAHVKAELTMQKTHVVLDDVNTVNLLLNPCDKDIMVPLDLKYIVTAEALPRPESLCVEKIAEFEAGSIEKLVIYRRTNL